MDQIKHFSKISDQELHNLNTFLCWDNQNNLSIFIKNSTKNTFQNVIKTDNLSIFLNTVQVANNKEYRFHVIESKTNDYFIKKQFQIIYEYIFEKITQPISDGELTKLIGSLEEYFRITADHDTQKLQVGVYGELLALKKIYELGYKKIFNFYHSNFYSKHDIEINSNIKIEIKTTAAEKRIHTFKHNQLSRSDCKVLVTSSLIEINETGTSLFELAGSIINILTDPDQIFSLRKLLKRCNVDEINQGIRTFLPLSLTHVKFYENQNIPKLNCEIPSGISNITYDVDLSNLQEDALILPESLK